MAELLARLEPDSISMTTKLETLGEIKSLFLPVLFRVVCGEKAFEMAPLQNTKWNQRRDLP